MISSSAQQISFKPSKCSKLISSIKGVFQGPVGLRSFLLGSKLNILFFICAPLAFAAEENDWGEAWAFVLAMLAIVPLAERLGYLTEQLTMHTNDTLGGMLNATFGNAVETLMSVVALVKARDAIASNKLEDADFFMTLIHTSLLGSMLSNVLLVQGSAFFLGGLRHPMQTFSREGAVTSAGLLVMATLALSIPTMLWTKQMPATATANQLAFSRFVSIVLLIIYLCFCLFQLRTHRFLFEKGHIVHQAVKKLNLDKDHQIEGLSDLGGDIELQREDIPVETLSSTPTASFSPEEMHVVEKPEIGLAFSMIYLLLSTVAVSFVSHVVVDAAQGAVTSWNLDPLFIGGVILPIVGNAAEHVSALMFAWKDKMDTSIAIAVGSAIQIPLFVLPVCVLCGWSLEVPLTLNLHQFMMTTVVLTSLAIAFTLHAGSSHWLHGLILIFEYIIIAAAFWFHDNE